MKISSTVLRTYKLSLTIKKTEATTLPQCNGFYKRVATKRTIKRVQRSGIFKIKMWVFLSFPEAGRKKKNLLIKSPIFPSGYCLKIICSHTCSKHLGLRLFYKSFALLKPIQMVGVDKMFVVSLNCSDNLILSSRICSGRNMCRGSICRLKKLISCAWLNVFRVLSNGFISRLIWQRKDPSAHIFFYVW